MPIKRHTNGHASARSMEESLREVRVTKDPGRKEAHQRTSVRAFFSSSETSVVGLSAICIVVYLVIRYVLHIQADAAFIPLYLTLIVGSITIFVDLVRQLIRREVGTDVLAGLAIITSILLGEYLVGSIIVLMFSGGVALEQFARHRASSVLDALAQRMPRIAHKKEGASLSDVPLDQVAVGDILVVLAHEYCPVDGVVIEGHGSMDESYLTGEPFEMAKAPGSTVLSGAINGENALTIRATRLAVDSRYARIMQVMQDAEQRRPRLRRLGDLLGGWYAPVTLIIAVAGWALTGDPDRFLAVIVIATPCPLLIGIPVAVIGAVSLAARHGIVIRNPAMLEQVDRCRTLIFDKTGTLTYGRPKLTEIMCAPGFMRESVLTLAASLEQYSKHPLALAVSKAANEAGVELQPVTQVSERPGEGMRGVVDSQNIYITGRQSAGSDQVPALSPTSDGLECLVFVDEQYAATLRFRDEPRHDSGSFVSHLFPQHGVDKVVLLSGDRESEVRYLAGLVGISEVHSAKSPEDKVQIVTEEARLASTLFVGDGINDAPAMQAATVGVAFGQNSDITAEAADAVIMDASLRRVDELIHIGRRMRRIALQSALGGMLLSGVGMLLAALGFLPPIAGAVTQEIIDVLAVANALRVTLPLNDLTDF